MAGRPLITARRRAAAALAVAAAALSLAAAFPLAAGGRREPRLDDLGQQPGAAVARVRIAAHDQERGSAASSRGRARSAASAPRSRSTCGASRSAGKRRDIYVTASESGRVSAFDALSRQGALDARARLRRARAACRCRRGSSASRARPVYDPVGGFVYVAATDRLWAIDVHTGAARTGWPVALPIDQYHEHVWGAIALGNGHVYFGIASYCDRRPYSGRVLAVSTKTGEVDHSWTSVNTADGRSRRRRHLGLGRRRDHERRPRLGGRRERQHRAGRTTSRSITPSRWSSSTRRSACSRASHAPGMPIKGDFGFGSTPVVFKSARCGALVAAEGKDGALYLWQRSKLAAGPGAAARAGLPGHALRLAGLGSADAAALRHDLAGLRRRARRDSTRSR